jgi:hypothetical protein
MLDLFAVAHDVLVDRVVDGLLEQDVDAVVGREPSPSLPMYMPGRMRMCSRQSSERMLSSV